MENTSTASRQLHITRTFKAPIAMVWKVWTEPEHIALWWGPNGFATTIQAMDFREGGEWRLTMHGPDGTNYPNRSIYKEIVPMEKIVFEHFNPGFIATILFSTEGDETRVDWTMEFETADMRDIVVKAHGADEGLKQNMIKLDAYLRNIKNQ